MNEAFWRDRPTLVTGATGLLGSWLTQKLVSCGADVVCLVRDWVPQSELVRGGAIERVKVVRADVRDRDALGLEADFANEGRVVSTPTFSAEDLARAAAALRALGRRPWPYRARRLGFDFKPIHEPPRRG